MHWSTSILIYFWHPLHICVKILQSCFRIHEKHWHWIYNEVNEVTDNVVDKDEDFLTSILERIEEFNYEISTSLWGSVSPLKRKILIRKKSIDNYVKKKKKIYF